MRMLWAWTIGTSGRLVGLACFGKTVLAEKAFLQLGNPFQQAAPWQRHEGRSNFTQVWGLAEPEMQPAHVPRLWLAQLQKALPTVSMSTCGVIAATSKPKIRTTFKEAGSGKRGGHQRCVYPAAADENHGHADRPAMAHRIRKDQLVEAVAC